MGHLRLGRLPKTLHWNEVVELVELAPGDDGALARTIILAAEARLRALSRDPSLTYCFWLLTRLTWAARAEDFVQTLGQLGIPTRAETATIAFISQVTDHVRAVITRYQESGPFGELGSLALRRALTETVGEQPASLFGSSVDDLRHALRVYSTRGRFGVLAQRFFGDFLARTLRYFLDRELSNHLAPSNGVAALDTGREVMDAIDRHARQSARIMQDFASGWYAKHNWESRGEIGLDEAAGFVAVALRKLRMELQREGA